MTLNLNALFIVLNENESDLISQFIILDDDRNNSSFIPEYQYSMYSTSSNSLHIHNYLLQDNSRNHQRKRIHTFVIFKMFSIIWSDSSGSLYTWNWKQSRITKNRIVVVIKPTHLCSDHHILVSNKPSCISCISIHLFSPTRSTNENTGNRIFINNHRFTDTTTQLFFFCLFIYLQCKAVTAIALNIFSVAWIL